MVSTSPQLLERVEDRVRAYAMELERLGVPVERIILFGSHARGDAGQDSDVDLAVFSECFGRDDHLEFSGILSAATWSTDPMIEALGFHPRVLRDVPRISFLSEILRTGRVVYQRPPSATAA